MDYSNLGISFIKNGKNHDVLITADRGFMEEFGEEFGALVAPEEDGRTKLREHLRTAYPGKDLGTARIILSGVVVSTFPLQDGQQTQGLTHNYSLRQAHEPGHITYCARSGETLESIAQKFYTSPDKIMALNHMDASVYVGQRLRIPAP